MPGTPTRRNTARKVIPLRDAARRASGSGTRGGGRNTRPAPESERRVFGPGSGVRRDLERVLMLAQRAGDRLLEARLHIILGDTVLVECETRRARDHYEQAFAIARELGNRELEATALSSWSFLVEAR